MIYLAYAVLAYAVLVVCAGIHGAAMMYRDEQREKDILNFSVRMGLSDEDIDALLAKDIAAAVRYGIEHTDERTDAVDQALVSYLHHRPPYTPGL